MFSQKILFGDIIYLNVDNKTLAAYSNDISPSFVYIGDCVRAPFRNAHFQILPAVGDSLSTPSTEISVETFCLNR